MVEVTAGLPVPGLKATGLPETPPSGVVVSPCCWLSSFFRFLLDNRLREGGKENSKS